MVYLELVDFIPERTPSPAARRRQPEEAEAT
jgi:hypothetical protein